MSEPAFSAPVATVRKRKLEATQRLLGDTIRITDQEWREPSLLPGWSRAHVATHVARNADALRQLVQHVSEGIEAPLYAATDRFADIESGAERTGLELQIDLDTTAGELNAAFDTLADWELPVTVGPRVTTLAELPVIRLHEVVMHHVDLDCGFTPSDLDPVPARWLLEWALQRRRDEPGLESVHVESHSGVQGQLGSGAPTLHVTGPDNALWGWVTGRRGPETVEGAGSLRLPLLA
ncbi:MAG: maleylpyruvate isomerase family mycothiol-dependent enzyme [Micropruina sp.]|nr:maleylpyruvate isomerase family mycothiol-dependent enzyme [Micropruina sp.]